MNFRVCTLPLKGSLFWLNEACSGDPVEKWTRDRTVSHCLSQGFYSCTNIMTKKQVGEERVYSACISTSLFISKGSQDWNSCRSGSRSWCRGHGEMFFTGLPPLACSACSLIKLRLPTQGWSHPKGAFRLITNWENALQLDLMEAFLQLKFLSLW